MKQLYLILQYSAKRILLTSYLLMTILLILYLGSDLHNKYAIKPLEALYQALNGESDFANVVVFIILFFLLTGILLLILLLIYTRQRALSEHTIKKNATLLVEILFKYLYAESVFTEEQKKSLSDAFKNEHKSDRKTMLIIETLCNVHGQTKGIIRVKTARIFEILNYHTFVRACLHSPQFDYKLFAMKVISEFQIEGESEYLFQLLNHRNSTIRSASLACLAHFESHADLRFLTQSSIKLSAWDINMLVQTVEEEHLTKVAIELLIDCEKPEIMLLGIILARLNKRIDLRGPIREKIVCSYPEVAEEATLTLISFSVFASDFIYLAEHYSKLSEKAKQAIIACMDGCYNKDVTVPFLEQVIQTEPLLLKIEALKCLLKIDMDRFSQFNSNEEPIIQMACKEVLDFNL